MMNNPDARLGASFRDPSGFLFTRQGTLFRQVNERYREDYTRLMEGGLYATLTQAGLLLPHQEVDLEPPDPSVAYRVIRPEALDFVSYPYEWSFNQLQDAALTTLKIQKLALGAGMTLKDSSAYNIQFQRGRPVLIDTLSFEVYRQGEPWVAYRQFCQHFLAPLALMALSDVRLSHLLRTFIDGIPLDLASSLLPARSRLNFGLLTHIHLHARAQRRFAGQPLEGAVARRQMSRNAFVGLLDSLEASVRKLRWTPASSDWADYYPRSAGHYGAEALEHKRRIVAQFLERVQPASVWDLGANTGLFSRLASERGIHTIAFDFDPAAVEQNYRTCVAHKETHLLPLWMDLTNPSPSLGWQHEERLSLLARGPAGAVMALALIHHLAISNNVPLDWLAEFFHRLGQWLIIEFVPKTDPMARRLLAAREDIFSDYGEEMFKNIFASRFTIHAVEPIPGTPRTLFLMEAC